MATPDEYPPQLDTPVGQIRSLIPDVELLEDPTDLSAPPKYIFSDAMLQSYLVIARNNVFRAAAIAVNTLATSEALILKVLTSDDRQTDGAKLAEALGARARWLNAQADDEEEEEALYEAFAIYPYREEPPLWGVR